MPREAKVYQFRNQGLLGHPAQFPQLRVHADGSEAGQRIDFVDEHFPVWLQEEVHAAQALAA